MTQIANQAVNSVVARNSIQQAVKILNANECHFRIETALGEVFGDLKLTPPAPAVLSQPKPAHKKRRAKRNYRQTGYLNKLAVMKVGDVEQFSPPAGHKPCEMQKAVHSAAARLWGSGNYTTALNKTVVEIMRIG